MHHKHQDVSFVCWTTPTETAHTVEVPALQHGLRSMPQPHILADDPHLRVNLPADHACPANYLARFTLKKGRHVTMLHGRCPAGLLRTNATPSMHVDCTPRHVDNTSKTGAIHR